MKTIDLIGPALDWAVSTCKSRPHSFTLRDSEPPLRVLLFQPSTNWSQGGPIIEREAIELTPDEYAGTWAAYMTNEGEPYEGTGTTPLIAAMRAYVASKLGDEVDVPEELKC
jgi:hypothetical protein